MVQVPWSRPTGTHKTFTSCRTHDTLLVATMAALWLRIVYPTGTQPCLVAIRSLLQLLLQRRHRLHHRLYHHLYHQLHLQPQVLLQVQPLAHPFDLFKPLHRRQHLVRSCHHRLAIATLPERQYLQAQSQKLQLSSHGHK